MSLTFPNRSRSYDAAGRRIRFVGHDGMFQISFSVAADAMSKMRPETAADEAGYLRDPNHVQMKVDFCRQLGLTDDDIRAYQPLPETIAMTCTMLFYVRRSYEEGLAVFGYAGERVAAGSGYAKTLYEGLGKHYGVEVKNFEVHAYAEPDHGQKAADLFRMVAETRTIQDRCRDAIRNYLLVAEARVRTMNRWVE